MGVVYYGNYLTLFERARNELMRACGYTYRECEADGVMLPVVHAEVNYHAPARYDDLLEITAFVSSQKGVRLEISCEVFRAKTHTRLASGFTRHCIVSAKDFRPMQAPPKLRAAFAQCTDGDA
jgi:acyl-CoA thioester hydrolase